MKIEETLLKAGGEKKRKVSNEDGSFCQNVTRLSSSSAANVGRDHLSSSDYLIMQLLKPDPRRRR